MNLQFARTEKRHEGKFFNALQKKSPVRGNNGVSIFYELPSCYDLPRRMRFESHFLVLNTVTNEISRTLRGFYDTPRDPAW